MKDVKMSIGTTNIKMLKYDNTFASKPGEPLKLSVKVQTAVQLNPAAPTTAMVLVHYECSDEEKKLITMEMDTLTPVNASTFVDNLDEVIKKNYINHVMVGVNERIRTVSSIIGITIQTPAIPFPYGDSQDSVNSEIYNKL